MENLLFLDFETKDEGLNGSLGPGWPYKNKLKVLGFSWSVDQSPPRWSTDIKFLKNLIKSSDYIIAHNAPYELGVLEHLNIDFSNKIIIDTVIFAKLYNNNLNSYSLNYLGKTYLNDEKFEEEFIKIAEELKLVKTVVQDRIKYCKENMDVVYENFPEVVIKYANQDVELLIKLYKFLSDKLKLTKNQVEFYSDLLKAVHQMRKSGVVIDVRKLLKNIEKMSLLYEESRELLIPFLGEKNPKSNKDIAEYLIEKGYNPPRTKPSKKFPEGQPSATKQWLSVQQGEFFELLLQFRKFDKILNTFLIKTRDMLLEAYNLTVDELREIKFLRIYPEIVPFGAPATGRFSSRNPNIQQMSKRDMLAKEMVRDLIHADADEKLYSLDFCYDNRTEVLTANGFKPWSNIISSDKLATYNEHGQIDFEHPSRLIELDYNGTMHHFKSDHLDILVSPNHRMIRLSADNKITEKLAKMGHKSGLKNIHAGLLRGGEDEELIQLVVAVQADGTLIVNSFGKLSGIRFKLKKQRKIDRLIHLLNKFNIKYTTNTPPSWLKDGFTCIYIPWFEKIERIAIKKFTTEYILKLSINSRIRLVEELRYWDGTGSGKLMTYFTSDKDTADAVQLAAISTGRRATISNSIGGFSNNIQYLIYIGDRSTTWTCKNTYSEVPYSGKIYCATVSTGMLVVRRNGKVTISGNCAQEPRLTIHYGALRGDKVAKILSNKMIHDPNFDLHQEVANLVGIERDTAKTINLGLAYGMGLASLAKSLKMSLSDAKFLLAKYHKKSPFIKKLTKETESVINNRGFIKTILGRSLRRETAVIDGELVDFAYKALNKLIQGSAADQTMAAIVFSYRNNIPLKFTIHDEIVISTDNILDVFKLKFIMENVMILGVPSKTDVKVGDNFLELSDFEENLSDSDQLEFNKFVSNFIPIIDFSTLRRELKNVRN